MKTYIFDNIINKVKEYSENIEVKSILCNKSWIVFNDTGEKEVLIFKNDNTMLATNNGKGVKTTWEWEPVNKSLIVDIDNSIIMLHPEFVNNTILALELDGTNQYTFLIDENNKENFAPKTLSELKQYFIYLEIKAIEAIEAKRQRLLREANEKEEQKKKEAERKEYQERLKRRKAQEIEKKRLAEENRRITFIHNE